jgi:hypothetical protein
MNANPITAVNPAIASNPFALMLEPQQVLDAVQGSRTLHGLRQQQYLLLDRPTAPASNAEMALFDAELDEAPEETLEPEDMPVSESIDGSHTYQSFPRIFN